MIGFRADANEHIASGHLVRCMTIADECCKRGIDCMFFLADNSSVGMLEERGFSYVVLDVPWNDWDSGVEKMKKAVEKYGVKKLVVDNYLVTANYLNTMNRTVPVIYLDDLCRQVYDIYGVIHYTQWEDERTMEDMYQGRNTKVLAGMSYIPLRKEFQEMCPKEKKQQIIITTGGTDTYHISLKVVRLLLQREEFKAYKILAILGCMNQDEEEFRQLEAQQEQLEVKKNVSNMAQLMQESKVAVSAGGTTLYEFCACRIPLVCFAFSEDHEGICGEFHRRGLGLYSGDARFEENVPENIVENLLKLLADEKMQESIRGKMKKLLDTNGAARIVEGLLEE